MLPTYLYIVSTVSSKLKLFDSSMGCDQIGSGEAAESLNNVKRYGESCKGASGQM
jgi:hypothetical protein